MDAFAPSLAPTIPWQLPSAATSFTPSTPWQLRSPSPFLTSSTSIRTAMASSSPIRSPPSWEELSETLGPHRETPFRLSHATVRTFLDGEQPALTFYRDNSSWCPYCQRVWLQLEEKRIPYRVEKINMNCYGPKPQWYLEMIPSGLLPAINLHGKVIPESLDIMMILEDAFPDHKPLLPSSSSPDRKAGVGSLLRLERRLFGSWLGCLRGGMWGSLGAFQKDLDSVDDSLRRFGGPYFLGEEFSLVDAVYAPFLERIAASVPYWIGLQIRGGRWPALNSWFNAMDSRQSYQAMKSDDFTITHTLEPQIGKCRVLPEGAAYRDMINGKDGSWDLPLKPEVTAWGTDDGTGTGNAKEEAAMSLINNHESIVKFALRAFNDPIASSQATSVDLGLRYVSHALLVGVENVGNLPGAISQDAATSAAYLRDRIGVPRDLTYPAARQLRAHLQWLVKALNSDL